MPDPDSTGDGTQASPQPGAPPAAPSDTRPAPAPPPPAGDEGAVRQKVLIGGVALLFTLTLVGLGFVVASGRKPPPTEQTYVPPPPDPNAVPNPRPDLLPDGTTVTDAGLQALTGSKTLEVLTLKGNKKVTDKGMDSLAECPKLLVLDLTGTEIGDAGAAALARCKSLKKLTLTGTRVTAKGVAELKAALPGCEIVRDEKK